MKQSSPSVALLVARFNSLVTEQPAGRRARSFAGCRVFGGEHFRAVRAGVLGVAAGGQGRCRILRYDAVIAIGCVIRGETAHFDYVAGRANDGLGQVAQMSNIPVIFGVLTAENAEQAMRRADPSGMNRGSEFAQAALDMLAFFAAV